MRSLILLTLLLTIAGAADLPFVRITIDSGQTFEGWYDAESYNFFDAENKEADLLGCTYPPDRIVKQTAKKAPRKMPEYVNKVLASWREAHPKVKTP